MYHEQDYSKKNRQKNFEKTSFSIRLVGFISITPLTGGSPHFARISSFSDENLHH